MKQKAREKWAGHVRRWRASGLTTREFALREGVNAATLSWWSSRLKTARREDAGTSISPLTFVEVTHAAPREPIEVVLSSGVRVRIPPDFDSGAVERLFDVLAARR
jgi:hypothetical protein